MNYSKWDEFLRVCWQRHPKFDVVAKEDSWLMKLIYYGLAMRLWCPDFMRTVTTTIGQTVYMPRALIGTKVGYCVLRHEEIHVADSRQWPGLFQVSYLGPIPFGPLNARWYWELRAYVESMRVWFEVYGEISDERIEWIVSVFMNSMYLWMGWPFEARLRAYLKAQRDKITSEGK